MYYVYLLENKQGKIYVGYSSNLKQRLKDHNSGHNEFTGRFRPWSLVYYEAYFSMVDARNRESQIKSYGSILGQLKKRIPQSLRDVLEFRE